MDLPRENLLRAFRGDLELRDASEGDAPTLFGHFAVFNRWTQIYDWFDGPFMERIAPGAFADTIENDQAQMRVLLEHGMDPQVGNKPIANLREVREDKVGAYYEAALLDGVPPLVTSGLRAGVYGASFRFQVMSEEVIDEPEPSKSNPKGLPERTITAARVFEFGPVTFGAYAEASAALRALDNQYLAHRLAADPDLLARLQTALQPDPTPEPAPANGDPKPMPAPPAPVRHISEREWHKLIERKFR